MISERETSVFYVSLSFCILFLPPYTFTLLPSPPLYSLPFVVFFSFHEEQTIARTIAITRVRSTQGWYSGYLEIPDFRPIMKGVTKMPARNLQKEVPFSCSPKRRELTPEISSSTLVISRVYVHAASCRYTSLYV